MGNDGGGSGESLEGWRWERVIMLVEGEAEKVGNWDFDRVWKGGRKNEMVRDWRYVLGGDSRRGTPVRNFSLGTRLELYLGKAFREWEGIGNWK